MDSKAGNKSTMNPKFTDRELELIAAAFMCLKDKARVDYDKVAQMCDFKNKTSAASSTRPVIKKLLALAPVPGQTKAKRAAAKAARGKKGAAASKAAEVSSSSGDDDDDADDESSDSSASSVAAVGAATAASKKRKTPAPEGTPDGGNGSPVSPRMPRAPRKKRVRTLPGGVLYPTGTGAGAGAGDGVHDDEEEEDDDDVFAGPRVPRRSLASLASLASMAGQYHHHHPSPSSAFGPVFPPAPASFPFPGGAPIEMPIHPHPYPSSPLLGAGPMAPFAHAAAGGYNRTTSADQPPRAPIHGAALAPAPGPDPAGPAMPAGPAVFDDGLIDPALMGIGPTGPNVGGAEGHPPSYDYPPSSAYDSEADAPGEDEDLFFPLVEAGEEVVQEGMVAEAEDEEWEEMEGIYDY